MSTTHALCILLHAGLRAGLRAGVRRWTVGVCVMIGTGCISVPPSLSTPLTVVGAHTRDVFDAERERSIVYEILYPATHKAADETELHAWIYAVPLARDVDIAAPGPRPLLLTSHGTGGSRWDFFWLAQGLVKRGWIVANVEHPGDNWADQAPLSSLQVWERPPDLSVVLDDLLSNEVWAERIDASRIAAAGHSVGGFTVLGLAGLKYDIDRALMECMQHRMNDTTCSWVRQTTFDFRRIDYRRSRRPLRDDRIRAVFAVAPAVAEAADVDAAARIEIPVHIVGGRRDRLTPYELHAAAYANWVKTASLTIIDRGNHYVAISPCNAWGRQFFTPCQDVRGFDRARAQQALVRTAEAFFESAFQMASDPTERLQ